ncbi:hypothetical protein D3C76_1710440 [compost metagenome]
MPARAGWLVKASRERKPVVPRAAINNAPLSGSRLSARVDSTSALAVLTFNLASAGSTQTKGSNLR